MTVSETPRAKTWRPPAPRPRDEPLGTLASMWVLRKNPIETWTKAHFELPILAGPSVLGSVAVVSDPSAIRHVFVDNAANYRKDDLQKRLLGPGLREGLLEAEGDQWRTQRRILAPLFTPKTVTSFAAAVVKEAEGLVARWSRLRPGGVLDVQPEMSKITLDILGRTVFSDGLGHDPDAFMAAIDRYFATVGRIDPFDVLDFPEWLPRLGKLGGRAALEFFDSAVLAIIAKRRSLVAKGEASPSSDILGLLLGARDPHTGEGLTDAEIQANVASFIGAGHETTANALTWSLFLLSGAPEWRERCAAEADEFLGGPPETLTERLVETRAVIDEAMRLYPPVAGMSRQALGPDDLCGRRIRKNALVIVSQWVLHRHRLLWSDPDSFDPSRFLPGAREKIDRFAYLPFGVGPRVCIGASFSLQESTIVLAHILRAFRLDLRKDHVVKPVQRISLRPHGGLPMVLRRRAAH